MNRRQALAMLTSLASAGCAASPPTTPTSTPPPLARAALRPTPRLTPTPYPSGGLGLFRDEWEARNGALKGSGPFFQYPGGALGVSFANDIVWYVERAWREPIAVDAAREESRRFVPRDAAEVRRYQTKLARRVDLYRSESLADRFREAAENGRRVDPWRGVEPGTFIVYYRETGDRVGSIVLSTGDNP